MEELLCIGCGAKIQTEDKESIEVKENDSSASSFLEALKEANTELSEDEEDSEIVEKQFETQEEVKEEPIQEEIISGYGESIFKK